MQSLILVFKTTYSIWINKELYITISTLFFKAGKDIQYHNARRAVHQRDLQFGDDGIRGFLNVLGGTPNPNLWVFAFLSCVFSFKMSI